MRYHPCLLLVAGLLPACFVCPQKALADNHSPTAELKPFLQKYCWDCHADGANEGNVSFDTLDAVRVENADLWKTIWEQVALKQMPPVDAEPQPNLLQRHEISLQITRELQSALKENGGFEAHLSPAKGNHLDHELLFGKQTVDYRPTSSPARLWRIHPQEHLVRLNELICREREYDPQWPGQRTRGDMIPPNLEGEVKVYYGLNRLIGWVGGTAAYAAAITGFPPFLSTEDHHGLRNYAHQYSVNGAEATRIASTAETILRFMAFGPDAEPYQFADRVGDIDQKYKHESLRGLSQSLFYSKTPTRPHTPLQDFMTAPGVSEEHLRASIRYLFHELTCRPATEAEVEDYLAVARRAIQDLGKEEGAILGLTPIFLHRDALFRPELVEYGQPDASGRVMLQGQELLLAINGAFSYIKPDAQLQVALENGTLKTREDVAREVERILHDPTIRKTRVLQFFREFFDYDRAGNICKDNRALNESGGAARSADSHYRAMFERTAATDCLIEMILAEDKNVLSELLTTNQVVVDPEIDRRYFGEFIGGETKYKPSKDKKEKNPLPEAVKPAEFPEGKTVRVRLGEVITPHRPDRLLTTIPTTQRRGILTDPSWLVSHTDAMDNHAILRGRWVRERLLGGAVPDVPITVDAMLPDEPGTTLRHRMRVTREEYCWKCHQLMDPLGLPFEMYNHIGLYRLKEQEEPVDTTGEIINSGDPELDGPVNNAIEMIERLAGSERVKQVFVRHAFRFWMGRNETLDDAPVLQAAYAAYRDHDGSMNALLTSLLTSDAFLYRTRE